jgi:phosphatidylglycerophosphate synthase
MLENYGRPVYQKIFINPLLQWQWFRSIHPNYLTLAACALGMLAGALITFDLPIYAFIALLISGYLDTLDGSLARLRGLHSPQGAALDIVCDRIVEASIVLGLYGLNPLERALPALGMLTSILVCVTSFLVVGMFIEKESHKSFFYSPGLIERCEAFLFFSAMILAPTAFSVWAWAFIGLTFWTGFKRLWDFMQTINFKECETDVSH